MWPWWLQYRLRPRTITFTMYLDICNKVPNNYNQMVYVYLYFFSLGRYLDPPIIVWFIVPTKKLEIIWTIMWLFDLHHLIQTLFYFLILQQVLDFFWRLDLLKNLHNWKKFHLTRVNSLIIGNVFRIGKNKFTTTSIAFCPKSNQTDNWWISKTGVAKGIARI